MSNILCDGMIGSLNKELSSLNNAVNAASNLFNNMGYILGTLTLPGASALDQASAALTQAANSMINGINLGPLGNVAKCVGLSGVGWNLNGTLNIIPDWLFNGLSNYLQSLLNNTLGNTMGAVMGMANNLIGMFNLSTIDKILQLIGCLDGQCSSTYSSSYPSQMSIEERLGGVGLDLNKNVDFQSMSPNTISSDYSSSLNDLAQSNYAVNNLLLTNAGYDSSDYYLNQQILSANTPYLPGYYTTSATDWGLVTKEY